ncbi:hypothetical protein H8E06_00585 [bacterium]|nr:hypothetical protein [bacterium]
MSDDGLDDLLGQLKNTNKSTKQICNQKKAELSIPPQEQERLEAFLIDKSTILIDQTITALQNVQQQVMAAPDPENISAYSELVKASSTAMENLNKINLMNKKHKSSKELKTMDIQAKTISDDKRLVGQALATREEIMEKLFKDAGVVEIIDADDITDSGKLTGG